MNKTKHKPDEAALCALAELFKVFGDSTRVKILHALSKSQLSVTELTEELCISQPAVSQQLRILKTAKLVKGERNGKSIMYSLDDEHVERIIQLGLEHIME